MIGSDFRFNPREVERVEVPTEVTIESYVSAFLDEEGVREKIASSMEWEEMQTSDENGLFKNALSGECATYSTNLMVYLGQKGVVANLFKSLSKGSCVHEFLAVTTKNGRTIVDPTLGQFVEFNDFFVGSYSELKQIFFDESRKFLAGKNLWATDKVLDTREKWFKELYGDVHCGGKKIELSDSDGKVGNSTNPRL